MMHEWLMPYGKNGVRGAKDIKIRLVGKLVINKNKNMFSTFFIHQLMHK
jgi:hypothetical protein